jgi:hypothetical protein
MNGDLVSVSGRAPFFALASPWFTFTPRKVLKAGERAEGVRAAEEAVQEAAGRGKGV